MSYAGRTPQVVAAKQPKSGDMALHTTNTTDANILRENPGEWVRSLESRARILKPTYGRIGPWDDHKRTISTSRNKHEKVKTENATLHPGADMAYIGWLTKNGAKKKASSLVVEFTTREQANMVMRESLVSGACQQDYELYD
jgi:hypothetical protein